MAYDYKLFWSDEAINNLESILDYLQNHWTQREVDHFKKQLRTLYSAKGISTCLEMRRMRIHLLIYYLLTALAKLLADT